MRLNDLVIHMPATERLVIQNVAAKFMNSWKVLS